MLVCEDVVDLILVSLFGEIHVQHLLHCFLNSVLTICRPWHSANSTNMSPCWFLSPKPYWPVHFSMHCTGPILALKSPMTMLKLDLLLGENVVNVFIYLLYLLTGMATGGHVDLDTL